MPRAMQYPIAITASMLLASFVAAEDAHVHLTIANGYRYIVSNGLPNHETGAFPNRNNPNRVQLQYHRYRVPVAPEALDESKPYFLMPFGVAINGIPFDPGAAEFWNGDRNWQYEALKGVVNLGLDENNAHVQPTGAYHYHGSPTGLIETLDPRKDMLLLGYGADGYPIYSDRGYRDPADPESGLVTLRSSYRLKEGVRASGPGGRYDGAFVQDFVYVPGAGDLDECNGRTGVTPEYPNGTYYYVITEDFPFIPRRFHGMPDDSFLRRGPGGGGQQAGPQRGHRPPPPPHHRRPQHGFPPPSAARF